MAREWAQVPAYQRSLAETLGRATGAPSSSPTSSAARTSCTRRRGGCSRTGWTSSKAERVAARGAAAVRCEAPSRATPARRPYPRSPRGSAGSRMYDIVQRSHIVRGGSPGATLGCRRSPLARRGGAERRRRPWPQRRRPMRSGWCSTRRGSSRRRRRWTRRARPPGRAERIAEIAAEIEREGIEYVFFQQVSISGHINGKGVVADYFPQVAEKGYQLVYGATADLFTDRAGATTSASAPRSPSSPRSPTSTPSTRLPWDPRVARVYCDCYDTETGELLDADPRQNLKRIAREVEEELGYTLPVRDRAGDDVAEARPGGRRPRGRDEALVLPHQPVRAAPSGDPRRRLLRQGDGARHELRRPRGRARPARAQLPLRPRRCAPPTTSPPTARSAPRWVASTACTPRSCRSRSPASRRTGTTTTSRSSTPRATTSSTTPTGRRSSPRSGCRFMGGILDHFRALVCVGSPDRQLLQAHVGLRLLGAGLQELRLAEPHLHGARRERRPLRVPRRRLGLQPVPDPGGAAHRRARRACAASSTRARRSRRTPTT